jgi:hypothetical protein
MNIKKIASPIALCIRDIKRGGRRGEEEAWS